MPLLRRCWYLIRYSQVSAFSPLRANADSMLAVKGALAIKTSRLAYEVVSAFGSGMTSRPIKQLQADIFSRGSSSIAACAFIFS